MRDDYCLLCASDEGVFLDIYSDPKFLGKIKCCLTSKYSDKDSISTNICYKCAFEVNQCSEFVNKYKLSRKTLGHRKRKENACCLCLEPGVDGQIFDLVKERHSTNDPLQKIQDIFQSDVSKSQSLLVCINCRYCLDVLYDLKLVYEAMNTKVKDSIVKGNKNVKIPKTKTQVISRKTTTNIRQQKGVHLMSDTDSDSSTTTVRRTRKNNVGTAEKKNRQCEKCETLVENGVDMFRFHRTGLTVCKDCWIKEEPAGRSAERKRINPKNTRKCSVFLKDVFDNDARLYKVEKDEFGNTTYIITDEGSESEERPAKRMKNLDTDKREIKKWSLRGKANTLKKSQSQTEESSSEESSSYKTRIKTESVSDGENRTRRGKRKLSPIEDVLVEYSSTKRKRVSPILTEQFKSPTTKKSEARSTKRVTRNVTVETKNEEQSTPTSKRGRKLKKRIENYDEENLEIKVEVEETKEEETKEEGTKEEGTKEEGTKEEETKVDDHEDQSYECKQCGLEFDDKSDKVNHLLTHSKNVTLKLHRVKADKSSAETSAESENEVETVENESNPVSQDESADVVKISKANENMDIDIEGNDSNGSEEADVVNTNSKTETETTEKVQENSTIESVEEAKNGDEKLEESHEKSIEKDETTKNDKSLEKEEKDECANDGEAADKEAVDEKVETAETNEDDESKNKEEEEKSEKDKRVSTPVDETAEDSETCNTENKRDVEKTETNKVKESDSDSVDLHLSQSSAENGSPAEHVDETANSVADDDESSRDKEAPVNGCSISKDNEEVQEANEIGKSNNASNLSSLDSTVENKKVN